MDDTPSTISVGELAASPRLRLAPSETALDPLQQTLSSSWLAYITTQHNDREMRVLKDFVEERIKQTNDSLAATWQHELAQHRAIAATSAAEAQLKWENTESDIKALQSLQGTCNLLRRELSQNRTQGVQDVADLSAKLAATQMQLEKLQASTNQRVEVLHGQLSLVLERTSDLERELEDVKMAKRELECKLAAVESEIDGITQVPDDSARLLAEIFARRDDLRAVLNNRSLANGATSGAARQPEGECQ
jgi:chromosome segregation ATPase